VHPLVFKFSEGIARRINLICSRLMLHGSVEELHRLGAQDVRAVIEELQGESLAAGAVFTEHDFDVEDRFEPELSAVRGGAGESSGSGGGNDGGNGSDGDDDTPPRPTGSDDRNALWRRRMRRQGRS
jgi:general secretion pathway protein A